MPVVTVVKENKEGGRHARGMEDMARGQPGVKAQDEVEQDTRQLIRHLGQVGVRRGNPGETRKIRISITVKWCEATREAGKKPLGSSGRLRHTACTSHVALRFGSEGVVEWPQSSLTTITGGCR
jgi:hypothetical protein